MQTMNIFQGLTEQGLGLDLGLSLADLMSCCETRSCHSRRHDDLERHNNCSSTIYSFSILCLTLLWLWSSTVVFAYFKVKSAKCLCLLPMVLVLLFWSQSWSCYFGLGLKNLVLFTLLLFKCSDLPRYHVLLVHGNNIGLPVATNDSYGYHRELSQGSLGALPSS